MPLIFLVLLTADKCTVPSALLATALATSTSTEQYVDGKGLTVEHVAEGAHILLTITAVLPDPAKPPEVADR